MSPVIETNGLTKVYRRRGGRARVLDGVDLVVPAGGVFGFLGPNGSGKTTTIRCLLGLVRPSGGEVRLFGRAVRRPDRATLARIGAIVEAPKFHPGLSGRVNLQLLASLGSVPRTAVDGALDMVGMAERAEDRFGTYSLGMRQRLAVAGALLKDPELLILDEPANGLDPAGIVEMRLLLRRLADQGRTVMVSSHQLSEIEQVCDRVAILARGRCIAEGSVADVVGAAAGGARVGVGLRPEQVGPALTRLEAAGWVASPEAPVAGQELIVVSVAAADGVTVDPAEINRALGAAGIWAASLEVRTATLEAAFLEMTMGVRPGEAAQ